MWEIIIRDIRSDWKLILVSNFLFVGKLDNMLANLRVGQLCENVNGTIFGSMITLLGLGTNIESLENLLLNIVRKNYWPHKWNLAILTTSRHALRNNTWFLSLKG